MREPANHIFIGINVLGLGYLASSWQANDHTASSLFDIDYWVNVAKIAEAGALDAVFLADGPGLRDPREHATGRFEPTAIWSRVAAETEHIGLIATLSTTFNDPFELARRFQTLDLLSGGRAAWNAVTTYSPEATDNFGLTETPGRDLRYRRADEFIELVHKLWRTAGGSSAVSHRGEFFQLEGGLGLPESRQGHPLLVQAGGSPEGRRIAGKYANGVFSAELDVRAGREHYELVKQTATRYGRSRDSVRILPGLYVTLGSTEDEAKARVDRLYEKIAGDPASKVLSNWFGTDVSLLDPTEPFPDHLLADIENADRFQGSLGFRESVIRDIKTKGATVGEYLRQIRYSGSGHAGFVGTPEQLADRLEHWFRAGAADGFNFMPDAFPDTLETIVDELVPILRRRGLFRHEYSGLSLAENIGLADRSVGAVAA